MDVIQRSDNTKSILIISLVLFVLIIGVSSIGLTVPGMYVHETVNWRVQSFGQDAIDLFLVAPVLLATSVLVFKKNLIAFFLWGGVNLYLIYTFLIYCFDLHFNKLFILYCFILGLSFYSFLYFLLFVARQTAAVGIYKDNSVRGTAVYFLVISCLFYMLWLSDILPAIIHNTVPADLIETGLVSNPVHVIDLSIFLPGLFITSIMLFRKKLFGLFIAPALLMFCILMDITIAVLAIAMKMKGIGSGYSVILFMGVFALFSLVLMIFLLKALVNTLHS